MARKTKRRPEASVDERSPRRYELGQELAAAQDVVESCRVRIVGWEWGETNKHLRTAAWHYWVIDADGSATGRAFAVSEAELAKWNPGRENHA